MSTLKMSLLPKIDRARENVCRMLNKRQYNVIDDEQMIFENPQTNQFIKVFLCLYSKLNIERIKAYIQDLEQSNIRHCIIIYEDVITSSCKKVLEYMVRFEFETFQLNEMQYDLTKHCLYNPHEKLSMDEIKSIESTKQFPIILKSDPVCRYFHFQRGDVIRVRRKDGIIVYRVVR